ncbi:MAG TPA: hypothetical protein ENJ09_12515 [Planctomycetes bacterium]|nr:hypothetical protein [Planctomycetota bacterium]
MDLAVRLFASLRERAGADELTLRGLPDALDIRGLKRELEERHPELGPLSHVRGVVGTTYVSDDTALAPGDEVSLLPPVSGGLPDGLEAGVFELSADPLDPEDARRRVAHPSAGAIVVFTGTTRDHNRGEEVTRLDYEAFEEMAGAEMARIFQACNEQYGPASARPGGLGPEALTLRMLCLHRTGTVEVGEPSVVIAVSSPHRDAAFRAARFLIDELKKSVPLWKKECYADGHHWIGDRS